MAGSILIYKKQKESSMKLAFKKTIASILCITMVPVMMTGCKKKTTSYSHTDFAMGTVTNITLYGTSDNLEQTEQKIINMEKKLEKQQLSWRLKSSQVSKINQKLEKNNGQAKVTGSLKGWLQQAIKILCRRKKHRRSNDRSINQTLGFRIKQPKGTRCK